MRGGPTGTSGRTFGDHRSGPSRSWGQSSLPSFLPCSPGRLLRRRQRRCNWGRPPRSPCWPAPGHRCSYVGHHRKCRAEPGFWKLLRRANPSRGNRDDLLHRCQRSRRIGQRSGAAHHRQERPDNRFRQRRGAITDYHVCLGGQPTRRPNADPRGLHVRPCGNRQYHRGQSSHSQWSRGCQRSVRLPGLIRPRHGVQQRGTA